MPKWKCPHCGGKQDKKEAPDCFHCADCPYSKCGDETVDVMEFLKESNAIEGVFDGNSLMQAKTAWDYLIKQKELNKGVICKTHKILMLHQPIMGYQRGYYRDEPVRVGGREGLKADQIEEAIEEWCKDVATSIKIAGKDGKHIKLDHITYEKIHPFIDGNGRTGRMFMNYQRLKAGLPILIIKNSEKQAYYQWFK